MFFQVAKKDKWSINQQICNLQTCVLKLDSRFHAFLLAQVFPIHLLSNIFLLIFLWFTFARDLFLHGTTLGLCLWDAARGRRSPCGSGRTWNLYGLPGTGLVTLFKATCFVLLHARAPWTPLAKITLDCNREQKKKFFRMNLVCTNYTFNIFRH